MARRRTYAILFAPETLDHLDAIERKDHRFIREAIDEQLKHEPEVPTRNRKPLEEPSAIGAAWVLWSVPRRSEPSEMTPNITAVMVKIVREIFTEDEVAIFEGDATVSTLLLALPLMSFWVLAPLVGVGTVVLGTAAAAGFVLLGNQFRELGLKNAEGVEAVLRKSFTSQGKSVGELETVREQLGFRYLRS